MLTIGVTLELPDPHRARLQAARISYGDPLGRTVSPHITILGPSEVHPDTLEEVGEHLKAAAAGVEPFDVELRGTGTFLPVSPVVFVQLARGISSCEQLEAAVRSGILHRETAFRYHPHVTVAQNVPVAQLERAYAELADFSTRFRADAMQLAVLGADEEWRPVRTYPLGGR